MAARTSLVFGLPIVLLFVAGGGCLELQAPFGNGNGGAGGAEASSSSSSSSSTISSSSSTSSSNGGQGGGGAGGEGQGGSASSSSSSASSSGTAGTVQCAGKTCMLGEVCCYNLQSPNQTQCRAKSNCSPLFNVPIPCDGPEDCEGQICCGTNVGTAFGQIYCQDACSGSASVVFCGQDPSVCPTGTTCKPSMQLGGGYNVCSK